MNKQIEEEILVVEPTSGWKSINFFELYRYRDLLYFFVWRDIKVRYKQTILGAAWAIIQPFFTMIIFSIFFGKLAKMPSDNIPYPVFTYTALVPWLFFAHGLTQSTNSLVSSSNLIQKVYFPRLILPLSAVISGVIDFVLAFLVLLVMMFYYNIVPTINIFFLPFLLFLAFIAALGVGIWLTALNVQFRDIRYIVPFLVQIWLFATPVAYPSSLLSQKWYLVYGLNPMVGVIDGFRWALLGTATMPGMSILISTIVSLLILITGIIYFSRMEKYFSDIV